MYTPQSKIDLRDITFGVEIETVRLGRESILQAIQGALRSSDPDRAWVYRNTGQVVERSHAGRERSWKVVSDGSLSSPNGCAWEIVSPILGGSPEQYAKDIADLQAVVRAVRRAGARVNSSCGIHVHVGADAFSHDGKNPAKKLRNLAKMVYKNDDLIAAANGINHARRAQWCKPVSDHLIEAISKDRNITLDRLNRHWYGDHNPRPNHYHHTRYHGLNLHNVWYRGTVEFRWFDGSLHAGVVKSNVQFCLALAAKAINSSSASAKKRPLRSSSAKYDFRTFLLELGLIGDEFKTARLHLCKRLTGDAAYKGGRPE